MLSTRALFLLGVLTSVPVTLADSSTYCLTSSAFKVCESSVISAGQSCTNIGCVCSNAQDNYGCYKSNCPNDPVLTDISSQVATVCSNAGVGGGAAPATTTAGSGSQTTASGSTTPAATGKSAGAALSPVVGGAAALAMLCCALAMI